MSVLLLRMHAMRRRGPDDRGDECLETMLGVVVLGRTRLSMIDLSSAGHKPMLSADGGYAIFFNGEIFNYRELRAWDMFSCWTLIPKSCWPHGGSGAVRVCHA